jgi:acyl dehydratase
VRGKLDDDEAVAGGHLDITVTSPDGAVVHDAVVNYGRATSSHTAQLGPRGASRRVPTGPKHAEYSVRFPGLPPVGSVVRVRVDTSPHNDSSTRK